MKYLANLTGFVNGQEIIVTGSGTIIEGVTEGEYSLIRMPDIFDPQILETLLITGYPNACRSIDGSPNVFKDKPYKYFRKVSFDNGGLLELETKCTLVEGVLHSTFHVVGDLKNAEPIVEAEPLIETWHPTDKNLLSGLFRFTWKTTSGNYLTADAHSVYEPSGVNNKLPILHRYIEITAKLDGDKFCLRQNSLLFQKIKSN